MLPYPRYLGRIGVLAIAPLRLQISLEAVLRTYADFLQSLFGLSIERAQNRTIEDNTWPGRTRQVRQIARFPISSQQPGKHRPALILQHAQLLIGDLHDIAVGLGSPPLLVGRYNFQSTSSGVNSINIRDDDIADGLLRTTNVAQIGNISGVIVRFDFSPGKKLAPE